MRFNMFTLHVRCYFMITADKLGCFQGCMLLSSAVPC
jgi:hypothetical protein